MFLKNYKQYFWNRYYVANKLGAGGGRSVSHTRQQAEYRAVMHAALRVTQTQVQILDPLVAQGRSGARLDVGKDLPKPFFSKGNFVIPISRTVLIATPPPFQTGLQKTLAHGNKRLGANHCRWSCIQAPKSLGISSLLCVLLLSWADFIVRKCPSGAGEELALRTTWGGIVVAVLGGQEPQSSALQIWRVGDG